MEEGSSFLLFMGVAIIGVLVFLGSIMIMALTMEYETFQGEVTYSEVVTEHGQIKYLLLGFNNQTPIRIHSGVGFNSSLDFTVHSKLVIELSRPTFWFYASDIYSVVSITKLPDNK